MMQVLLQPTGKDNHYDETIERLVPATKILNNVRATDKTRLRPLLRGQPPVGVWGVKNSAASKWSRVQVGDAVLFARHGKLVKLAYVIATVRAPRLARFLWKTKQGEAPWECIYLISDLRPLNIPYAKFHDFSVKKYPMRGLNVLNAEASQPIVKTLKLGQPNRRARSIEARNAWLQLDMLEDDGTDGNRMQKVRKEQRPLRDFLLKGASSARCSICRKLFGENLLWASHIKQRSKCTTAERRDFRNIAALMCVLGCDALFERGYIIVGRGGVIALGRPSNSPEVIARTNKLVGKQCNAWTAQSEPYFKWHRQDKGETVARDLTT